MTSGSLLGKQELLLWACQHSGVPQCMRYDDLKDGFVFLCLAERLWPGLVDASMVRSQRRSARSTKLNWEVLRSVMTSVGLPLHLCDQKGVAAGHQRPCYNLLVMFYFLSKLSISTEFSVDFAHPIDEELAAFLQSPASVQCLTIGQRGAAHMGTPSSASTSAAATRAAFAHHPTPASAAGEADDVRSVSPAHPAPSPQRQAPAATPRAHRNAAAADTPSSSSAVSGMRGTAHNANATQPNEDSHRLQLQQAIRSKELIEQELQYVRAMSKHLLEQQRLQVEAELARAAGQVQGQLTTAKMEAEFELQQCVTTLRADYDRLLDEIAMDRGGAIGPGVHGGTDPAVALRQANAVLAGKVQALETGLQRANRHAAQIKEAFDTTRQQLERLASQVQLRAVRGIESIRDASSGQLVAEALENVSAAEKGVVLQYFRQLQLEAGELKAKCDRLELEKSALLSSGQPSPSLLTHACGESDAATWRLQAQFERVKSANAFLHEQIRLLRKGSGSPVGAEEALAVWSAGDAQAEHLDGGDYVIASATVGLNSAEAFCGSVLDRIQELNNTVPSETAEGVRRAFWSLASFSQLLAARLRNNAATLREMHGSLAAAQRQLTVERHRHAKQLREEVEAIKAQFREQSALTYKQLSDAELEVRLARDEVTNTRREAGQAVARLQLIATELVAECDRHLSAPQGKLQVLTKQLVQLRTREQQWQRALEVWDQAARLPHNSAERGSLEQQLRCIWAPLRGPLPPPPTTSDASERRGADAEGSDGDTRAALGRLREVLETSLKKWFAGVEQVSVLSDELHRATKELSTARSELELLRAQHEADALTVRRAQEECAALTETVAGLRSSDDTSKSALRALAAEFPKLLDECNARLLAALSEGGKDYSSSTGTLGGAIARPQALSTALEVGHTATPLSVENFRPALAAASAASSSSVPASGGSGAAVPLHYERLATASVGALEGASAGVGSAARGRSSSILSPEELERRKKDILAKYGVKQSQ